MNYDINKISEEYFNDMKSRNIIADCWIFTRSRIIEDKVIISFENKNRSIQSYSISISEINSYYRNKKINQILDI